eukprot:5125313-Ditylum_brightwellii.AAC.1
MEAKYIAFAHSMRELLPARWLVEELIEALHLDIKTLSTISTVWEDNNGALTLANSPLPRMTHWFKHICVEYHWFHSWINGTTAKAVDVDTDLQKADILTKPLGENGFPIKRKLIMG